MISCYKCRDEGMEGGCPRCGKTPAVQETKFFDADKLLGIPQQYQTDLEWDSSKLLANHKHREHDNLFKVYIKFLDSYYDTVKSGVLVNKSVMIISDRGYGKHTFAYAVMNQLAKRGMSVCQILDHNEYLRLNIISTDRPFAKGRVSMDDVVNSDLFVMTIDPSNKYSAMKAIQSVLSKRGHVGKPTMLISDYPLSQLSTGANADIDIRHQEGYDDLRYCRIVKA